MRTRMFGGIAALVLAISAFGFVHWRYGSLANAVAYFDNNAVQVDKPIRDLGTVKCGGEFKVAFNVTNLQREQLRIVGARASCSCILPPEMPMTLEPFKAAPLTFTFTSPSQARHFEQEIELYFDGPIPAMLLKISGVSR